MDNDEQNLNLQEASEQKDKAKFLTAGTKIVFEKALVDKFGTITVVEGVLDIVYFDGTTALVKMGKFPIHSATVLTDSWVIIGDTDLKVVIEGAEDKSRSRHRKWYDWSCWR